jgi:glyoxalase superfamily protein
MTDAQPYTVQIVIDCAEPHPLADWWAEALGWEVEPQDPDFIRSMVDQGLATDEQTSTHRGALVWATAAAINHPDGTDRVPRILFMQVPEPKTVKNRLHLDLRGAVEPSLAERDRLLALGATEVGSGTEGPQTAWVVLTDPEGNELCLPVPTGS